MTSPLWKLDDGRGALACGALRASVNTSSPQNGLRDLALQGEELSGHLFAVDWAPPSPDQIAPSEVYVRDADLVAFYSQSEAYPFRREVYWRSGASSDTEHSDTEHSDTEHSLASIDLLASIQTDLLDSHPSVVVRSEMPAVEVLRMTEPSDRTEPLEERDHSEGQFETIFDAGSDGAESKDGAPKIFESAEKFFCTVTRMPKDKSGNSFSYAEMVHPSDLGKTTLSVLSKASGKAAYLQVEHTLMADFLEKGVIRRARLRGVFLDREHDTEQAAQWYRSFVAEELPLNA